MKVTTELAEIDEQIEKLSKLLELEREIDRQSKNLCFISIKEFAEISGWAVITVQNLFNRPDFPSCDFGKEKKAEIHAVIKYFSIPRRKNEKQKGRYV